MSQVNTRGMHCGHCRLKINRYDDQIKCVSCEEVLHLKCASVSIEKFHDMNREKTVEQWLCVSCANSKPVNEDTKSDPSEVSQKKNNDLSKCQGEDHTNSNSSCHGCNEIDSLREEIIKLNKTINLQSTVISDMREEFLNQISEFKNLLYKLNFNRNEVHTQNVKNDKTENVVSLHTDKITNSNATVSTQRQQSQHRAIKKTYSEMTKSASSTQSSRGKVVHVPASEPITTPQSAADKSSGDGFQEVARRKRRQSNIVVGSGKTSDDGFMGIKNKLWMFVGRVASGTTSEMILQYLRRKYNEESFSCEKLETKTEYSCFKISAPTELREVLEKADSWPQGVVVRKFRFYRKRDDFLGKPSISQTTQN